MNRTFWKGRKVLVTGHTGFKGSWISLWLQRLGADLCGYALPPPTQPSLFQVANVAEGMRSVTGDVRDIDAFGKAVADHDPEIIVHMAAQSMVRHSYRDPVETYSSNVMGTVNVLETVRTTGRPRSVVVVTTDKCYENREWTWGYRENDVLGGRDPYSNSKACAELVTSAYRDSFFPVEDFANHGVAIASARAGNVLGGGDWTKDQLVPDVMRAFLAGTSASIRNPMAVRPWQFVLDTLNGYLSLAERLAIRGAAYSEGFNFGPENADVQPVSWIVDRLAAHWGDGARWEVDGGSHPHEANFLKLDSTKAREMLSWKTRVPLTGTLDLVAEWYRAMHRGEEMRRFSEAQIAAFEEIPGVEEGFGK